MVKMLPMLLLDDDLAAAIQASLQDKTVGPQANGVATLKDDLRAPGAVAREYVNELQAHGARRLLTGRALTLLMSLSPHYWIMNQDLSTDLVDSRATNKRLY